MSLQLLPTHLFPYEVFPRECTPSHSYSDTPVFNRIYELLVFPLLSSDRNSLIPEEEFFTNGAVLCLSVLARRFECETLLGQTFVALNRIPNMGELSSKALSEPITLSLLRAPLLSRHSAAFQVPRLKYNFFRSSKSEHPKIARQATSATTWFLRKTSLSLLCVSEFVDGASFTLSTELSFRNKLLLS